MQLVDYLVDEQIGVLDSPDQFALARSVAAVAFHWLEGHGRHA